MVVSSGGSRIFLRGGANSQRPITLQMFCRKLHENERIWTPGGVPGVPPDPPMVSITALLKSFLFKVYLWTKILDIWKPQHWLLNFISKIHTAALHKKVHTNLRERNKFYEYSEGFGDQSYSRNDTLAACGSVVRKLLWVSDDPWNKHFFIQNTFIIRLMSQCDWAR